MVHKPTAISVIAPVTVAGILIMAILATILSINQGFAQEKKPTELTLNLSPLNNSITRTHEVTGRLTSEGSGVGGAAITVEVPGYGRLEDTTNNDGGYSSTFHLGPGKDTIKVEFSGNSEYEPSSKTQVYTVPGSQPDKPTVNEMFNKTLKKELEPIMLHIEDGYLGGKCNFEYGFPKSVV